MSSAAQTVKNIFVIEDDRIVSRILETVFVGRGHKVHQFYDGNEANNAISTMTPPDLILLDIVLPYIDGYRLLERIRTKSVWKTVPTVMISSNSNEANIVRAFEVGADDYMTKPIQIEELVVRANRFLR